MTIRIETSYYGFVHGKAPRGTGCWAFGKERSSDVLSDDVLWSPTMSYADAKKWAVREATKRGWYAIHVMT